MQKTDKPKIDNALSWLVSEAELMKKKQEQMKRFLKSSNNEFTEIIEEDNIEYEISEIENVMKEIEEEKNQNSELLNFYKCFEDLKDVLLETVNSEKKLRKNCQEIFRGKIKKKDLCLIVIYKIH